MSISTSVVEPRTIQLQTFVFVLIAAILSTAVVTVAIMRSSSSSRSCASALNFADRTNNGFADFLTALQSNDSAGMTAATSDTKVWITLYNSAADNCRKA